MVSTSQHTVTVPLNDLSRIYQRYGSRIETEVTETLRSGQWLNGKRGRDFSERFAEFVGVRHCIPVANGTDALELTLRTVSAARPGHDQVITAANAGGYTSTATFCAGLRPVYADVEATTSLLSASSALNCITPYTLAIVATHLYGGMADIPSLRDGLRKIGREDIFVIEDCAQAHGAGASGKRAGSLGDMATFSFYPTKNLGGMGDAGAIMTNSDNLAETANQLRQYGWSSKYTISRAGGRNSRMDEVQAAILGSLLPHLDELNAEKEAILEIYGNACPAHIHPIERPSGSIVHLAVLLCERRDELRSHLAERGISTDIHYPILDCDQPGWKGLVSDSDESSLPNSRSNTSRLLSVPCFAGMTQDEISRVAVALGEFPL